MLDRRHRAGVLRHLELRGREHGPALQLGRRGAGRHPRGREEDRLRPVQRPGHRLHRRRARARSRRPRTSPIKQFKDTVPIKDANSVALKLVQAAGKDGGVVLNFTPPEALKILQAAQKLGLQDRVVSWGCSTPCNTDFVAKALGPKWDDKLLVNAELNVTDFDGPDSTLYRDVLSKYGKKVTGGLGSFSQMGFVLGDIATKALLSIKGDITQKSVNEAIKAMKDYKTDILCKPWYYRRRAAHIPNNTDWTTTTKDGKMVIKEDCFDDRRRGSGHRQDPCHREEGRDQPVATGSTGGRDEGLEPKPPGSCACLAGRSSSPSSSPAWPSAASTGCRGSGWWSSTGRPACSTSRSARSARSARSSRGRSSTTRTWPTGSATSCACSSAGCARCVYGVIFGPPLAGRDPLVKATATIGLALILLGAMSWIWSDKARSMTLPTSNHYFTVTDVQVTYTQVLALGPGRRDHRRHHAVPALHQARHRDAWPGQRPRDHGHARRAGAARRGLGLVRLRAASPARPACCCPTSSGSTPRR